MSQLSSLTPAEKLAALCELDIFHHWDSIDEKRLCRRCGQIISGREIKVTGSRRSPAGVRLECPTEGCPSVPFEWLMLELGTEFASQPQMDGRESEIAPRRTPSNSAPAPQDRRFFRFPRLRR